MDPAEREAAAREQLAAEFERRCPGILGNPFVAKWPFPKQQLFLGLHLLHHRPDDDQTFEALYGGAASTGKALRLDEPIPTPGGWTTIGEILPGQQILDEHRRPTTVVQVHPTIRSPRSYRVWFVDGSRIECSAEHQWLTYDRRDLDGKPRVRSTEQIASSVEDVDGLNHSIPVSRGGTLNAIEWVEPADPFPMRCITVSGSSGLFLAGPAELVTHNSEMLLMAAGQYAWQHGDFVGVLIRRTFAQLAQPNALMDRALQWWGGKAHWNGQRNQFRFPSGAVVQFAYHDHPRHNDNFHGAEYNMVGWDELTQWADDRAYKWVSFSRVRRTTKIPLRALSTSNPGGPGHSWVKTRFIGGEVDETGEEIEPTGIYLPATIRDNPHVDVDAYIRNLMHMHPVVRRQLLDGDWSARDPGQYFQAQWFGPFLDPIEDVWPSSDCVRVRWWDLAAGTKPEHAKTAGVRMARHANGSRVIEHVAAFRKTPGDRDNNIIQIAEADGKSVIVGIEIEGGSGGIAQFEGLKKRLEAKGFRVEGKRPTNPNRALFWSRNPHAMSAKMGRADPVASCLERGYERRAEGGDHLAPWYGEDEHKPAWLHQDGIRLMRGGWVTSFLDVIEAFPEGPTCDEVDAMSGAWSYLEEHPAGSRRAPAIVQPRRTVTADTHPDDADEYRGDRRGRRWDL